MCVDEHVDVHITMDFGPASSAPLITEVQCSGNEGVIDECESKIVSSNHTCYPAGVMCDGR